MCGILGIILLICMWILNDWELRTKLIVTGVYILTWALILVDGWVFAGAQGLFALIVGAFTFGGHLKR